MQYRVRLFIQVYDTGWNYVNKYYTGWDILTSIWYRMKFCEQAQYRVRLFEQVYDTVWNYVNKYNTGWDYLIKYMIQDEIMWTSTIQGEIILTSI